MYNISRRLPEETYKRVFNILRVSQSISPQAGMLKHVQSSVEKNKMYKIEKYVTVIHRIAFGLAFLLIRRS